ncbi:MAG TPA: aspartate/glutamate racemase family protein, partial [Demequina sp.]|nr:aspartate/glutamate racemase family protein [Demequina sp.]
SSLGPALDVAARAVNIPVVKIDEAMAIRAALEGKRIGVLATVPTTLAPTSELIRSKAIELGRAVEIEQRLCAGAFDILVAGDREKHDAMVTEQAVDLAKGVDIIVLAQASMSRLASSLGEITGLPVLSSPRIGVEYLAERVAALQP